MKRQLSLEAIERGLKDADCDVCRAAMNACQGRDVPIEIIERWLKDADWRVRRAAMNACQGRDVPIEIIERGLKDADWRVCTAAMVIAKEIGMQIPPYRAIEPPELVYKKCLNNVIVIASIPKDAEIRGAKGDKCRANKAKIVKIDGECCGEKVGISLYDLKTCYFEGDEIEIMNFDYSNKECSTGFHFFCTKKEAVEYDY